MRSGHEHRRFQRGHRRAPAATRTRSRRQQAAHPLRQLFQVEPLSADVAVCAARLSRPVRRTGGLDGRGHRPAARIVTVDRGSNIVDRRPLLARCGPCATRRAESLWEQSPPRGALIGRTRQPAERLATLSDDELAAHIIESSTTTSKAAPAPDLSFDML